MARKSKGMGRVIRMSITVPASLKQRMDAVQDFVNWSATAAEAFKRKVDQLDREGAKREEKGEE